MFFAKSLSKLPSRRAKIRSDLAFDGNNSCTYTFTNVKKVANSLYSTDLAFKDTQFKPYALKVLRVTDIEMYVLAKDGIYLHNFDAGTSTKLINNSRPDATAIVDRDEMIVSGEGLGVYYVDLDDTVQHPFEVGFNSLVVSSERLIGVYNNTLYFNESGQRDLWDVSLIKLHTKCDAVCQVGEKVYLLGDICYLVTSDYDAKEQSVKQVYSGIGKVYVNSIVHYDGKVIFATDKGLHVLSPSGSISPIFAEINPHISFDGCVACKFQGKYYLSCRRKSVGSTQNDVTLILNPDTQRIEGVLGNGYEAMYAYGDNLYVVSESKVLKSCLGNVTSNWSCEADFSTDDVKHLQGLAIQTQNYIEVWISNGNISRLYRFNGKKSVQRIPIRGAGRKFTIKLCASNGMQVDYLQLTATIYNGEV